MDDIQFAHPRIWWPGNDRRACVVRVAEGDRRSSVAVKFWGNLLCARDAALAHPDNKLSGPPEKDTPRQTAGNPTQEIKIHPQSS